MWVKLDSQLPPVGSEPRNCLLKEQELWEAEWREKGRRVKHRASVTTKDYSQTLKP